MSRRVPVHFDAFQPGAVPSAKERGFRAARPMAAAIIDRAIPFSEDPDVAAIWSLGHSDEWQDEWHSIEEEEAGEWMGFTYAELPDLFGMPRNDPHGRVWSERERLAITEQAILAGIEVRHGLPRWLAEAMMEDLIERKRLRLVAVPKDEAIVFVAEHHSTLPRLNTKGLMYALGVVEDGRLVAVATAGTPTGKWKDPHRVLELTRVASDGTVLGASSMLVARLIDVLPKSLRKGAVGPALFVTYSLSTEEGTTYRALRDKGLRPVVRQVGKRRRSGARSSGNDDALVGLSKIRWEAGPGARPGDWSLLDPAHDEAATIVDAVEAGLRRRPPPGVDRAYLAAFFARQRRQLHTLVAGLLAERGGSRVIAERMTA